MCSEDRSSPMKELQFARAVKRNMKKRPLRLGDVVAYVGSPNDLGICAEFFPAVSATKENGFERRRAKVVVIWFNGEHQDDVCEFARAEYPCRRTSWRRWTCALPDIDEADAITGLTDTGCVERVHGHWSEAQCERLVRQAHARMDRYEVAVDEVRKEKRAKAVW